MVVRTRAALDRLLDVLPVLADDLRIETWFTVVPGSEFAGGLVEELHRIGALVVDWVSVEPREFTFAVAASEKGPLTELGIPLLVLPHGAGPHKHAATGSGVSGEIAGLARDELVADGALVPDVVGLGHPDHLDLLRARCPEAVARAEVIGDPCLDRLQASLPGRSAYRHALGVANERLVLVASTWGPESLFGRHGKLPADLVAALPDDHRVAAALHPNVWTRHGHLNLGHWTRSARTGGLLLAEPLGGWQAALVAADVVVSDHGSLAMYAAALGKPLLLAAFGRSEVVAGSRMAELGARADHLLPGEPLRERIAAATSVPEHAKLIENTFAPSGFARLRRVLHRELGLPEPSWPAAPPPVSARPWVDGFR
nr:hypothetical protein [Saccharopolyspora sp. HNM0983]